MSTEHIRLVLQRFDALLGEDDLTELDDLCTPPRVNHARAPDRRDGLADTGSSCGLKAVPDDRQHWVELVVVAEGDHVVRFGRRGGDWAGGSRIRGSTASTADPFRRPLVPRRRHRRHAAFALFGPPPPCPLHDPQRGAPKWRLRNPRCSPNQVRGLCRGEPMDGK
ncbi:MAG: hypothetical protein ACXWZL_13480 [Mycobacterium sp.]